MRACGCARGVAVGRVRVCGICVSRPRQVQSSHRVSKKPRGVDAAKTNSTAPALSPLAHTCTPTRPISAPTSLLPLRCPGVDDARRLAGWSVDGPIATPPLGLDPHASGQRACNRHPPSPLAHGRSMGVRRRVRVVCSRRARCCWWSALFCQVTGKRRPSGRRREAAADGRRGTNSSRSRRPLQAC